MDIKLEKKPWYIRYRYYLIGGILFVAFLIYVITLSLGPRKLRIDAEDIQIAYWKVHIKSVWEKNEESLLVISYFPHFG